MRREEMERDRDDLLQGHARRVLPRMLHVREVRMDGTLEVSGTFGEGMWFVKRKRGAYRALNLHNTSSYGSAPC